MEYRHAARVASVAALILIGAPISWALGQARPHCMVFEIPDTTLHVSRVEELRVPDRSVRAATSRLVGATVDVTVESQFAVNERWLERTLRERASTMIPQAASMPDCPFVVEGVQVHVSPAGPSAFRVEIRVEDTTAAREVIRRARASFPTDR